MHVFNGGMENDGWAAAHAFVVSVGRSCSCLWFNAANKKVEVMTMTRDWLGYRTTRGERLESAVRYYSDREGLKTDDIVQVYGWYDKQEWVEVRLVRLTRFGWLVARRDRTGV